MRLSEKLREIRESGEIDEMRLYCEECDYTLLDWDEADLSKEPRMVEQQTITATGVHERQSGCSQESIIFEVNATEDAEVEEISTTITVENEEVM